MAGPPAWQVPPPPPPPWLQPEARLPALCAATEDGARCGDLPAVTATLPFTGLFHSVTVILVSAVTIVITVLLLAATLWRHRARAIHKFETLFLEGSPQLASVEERYKQRCRPNQYMGERRAGEATAGPAVRTVMVKGDLWARGLPVVCPHEPTEQAVEGPIYETIDDSFETGSSSMYECVPPPPPPLAPPWRLVLVGTEGWADLRRAGPGPTDSHSLARPPRAPAAPCDMAHYL
jgi:hypothetical protein